VAGALSQEIIDVLTIFDALRVAIRPAGLSDFGSVTGTAPSPVTAISGE
jgi:hypothetical protein